MRLSLLPPLAACLLLLLPACRDGRDRTPEWEKALRELDRSLAQEAGLSQKHVADLADLKIQFKHTTVPRARYRFCDRIFDGYLKYDVDSALRYAHMKDGIAAEVDDPELRLDAALDLAQRYLISGMYHTALETVNAADTASVRSPRLQATYYQTLNSIYHGMALAAKDPEMATRFRTQELLYQQRSRAALTEDMLDYYTVNAGIEIENGHPERARQLMEERLADERLSLQDRAIVHYWIAKTYREEGDQENELKHYAISANCDQLAPVKASRSLIRLSRILYERGDVERAYTYIVRAYEDATRSDARTALDEINQSQPGIIASYEKLEQRRQRQLKAFLAVTILILTALGFALLRLYRNHKRIGRMQRQILENVERLKESNQIKDTYLGRYLSMFSEHIDALERYRSRLRVTAKSKDLDDILRVLKSDAYIDTDFPGRVPGLCQPAERPPAGRGPDRAGPAGRQALQRAPHLRPHPPGRHRIGPDRPVSEEIPLHRLQLPRQTEKRRGLRPRRIREKADGNREPRLAYQLIAGFVSASFSWSSVRRRTLMPASWNQ